MAKPVQFTVDMAPYIEAMSAAHRAARRNAIGNGHTEPWEWDLALALGYEPESWDGMWKLVNHPFTIGKDYVLAEEVVYHDGDDLGTSRYTDDNRAITRHVRHPLPAGWTTEPLYRAIPPQDNA